MQSSRNRNLALMVRKKNTSCPSPASNREYLKAGNLASRGDARHGIAVPHRLPFARLPGE